MRTLVLIGLAVCIGAVAGPAHSQQATQWVPVANSDNAYSFVQSSAIGQGEGWIMRVGIGNDAQQRLYRSRIFRSMAYYRANCGAGTMQALEGAQFAEPSGEAAGSYSVPGNEGRVLPDSVGAAEHSALCDLGGVSQDEWYLLSDAVSISMALLNDGYSSPKE